MRNFFAFFPQHKVLLGFFVFISIYIGALFAFATQVAPGTVLDPAGLPGSYTVSVVGYDSSGNVTITTGDSLSATTGLLVENSTGTDMFTLSNKGVGVLNNTLTSFSGSANTLATNTTITTTGNTNNTDYEIVSFKPTIQITDNHNHNEIFVANGAFFNILGLVL